MKTDLQVIDDAIEILTPDTAWTKGQWCSRQYDADGELTNELTYCAEGALAVAVCDPYQVWNEEHPEDYKVWLKNLSHLHPIDSAPHQYIERRFGPEYREQLTRISSELAAEYEAPSVPDFNDDPEVSREDILAGMKDLRARYLDRQLAEYKR